MRVLALTIAATLLAAALPATAASIAPTPAFKNASAVIAVAAKKTKKKHEKVEYMRSAS